MSDNDDKTPEKEARNKTDKGKAYHVHLLEKERMSTQRSWRKQLNKTESLLADSSEVSLLQNERAFLETRMEILTAAHENYEDALECPIERRVATEKFETFEHENSSLLKRLNERVIELKRDKSSTYSESTKTSRSCKTSRSSNSSKCSRKSTLAHKTEMAAIIARLGTELKFQDIETQRKDALRKQEDEFKKFQISKKLALAKAEMNAVIQVQEEEFGIAGSILDTLPNERDTKNALHDYLDAQMNFVKENTPVTQSGCNTLNKDIKRESNTTTSEQTSEQNPFKTSYSDPLQPKIKPELPYSPMNPFASTFVVHSKLENPPLLSESYNPFKAPTWPKQDTPRLGVVPSDKNDNKDSMSTNDDTLHRLADLLSQRRTRDSLPLPEPEIFRGNMFHYPTWLKSFETIIESQTEKPSQRIYYLGKYTAGEAKEAISGLLPLDNADAYLTAKNILSARYGNPFLVADAYRKRITEWPRIPPNDGVSLRKFSDFMLHCLTAMNSIDYLKVLNDPDENQKMIRKLPKYLVSRWSRIIDKWITEENKDGSRYPPFAVFCEFLKTEARIACNPVTSFRALKDEPDGREDIERGRVSSAMPRKRYIGANSFATGLKEVYSKGKEGSSDSHACPLCKGPHGLNECRAFLKLTLTERKDIAREKALCWGCLRQGHFSRQCRMKRNCNICEGPHPSSLHDYAFQKEKLKRETAKTDGEPPVRVTSNRVGVQNTISSHSLIVPVWLRHRDRPDKELMVYALLDEQSDACFIKDTTFQQLGINGTEVSLMLSTMLGEEKITSKKVTGLTVRGVNEERDISLPRVYTRETIPAERSQIPRPETALGWPHLTGIAEHLMPHNEDIEIGILIGLNCACAIKPREVILGNDDDPYAKRTALGWGVIGIVTPKECVEANERYTVTANRIAAQELQTPHNKGMCHLAIKTEVKEIISPQQVNKMFELDFNDREVNDRSLSQEDRRFLEIVERETHQNKDGHYEMPLPFKNDIVSFQNNKDMATNRLKHLKKRLQNDAKYRDDYDTFMKNVIDSGHAERVPKEEISLRNGKVWYIPHHGVYHPKKPGKIRVVFDCSATSRGESLNKQLLQGPDLTNNLVGVLCRFRQEPIAFMCDIEKMFHQVKVNEECRDFLRFLWWEGGVLESEPAEYRMTVHLFGAVSSPGCANFGLKRTAKDFQGEYGNEAAKFIDRDFYVDDGLKSVPTIEDAVTLIKNTKDLCQKGSFHLHKFVSNSKEVIQTIPQHERAEGIKELNLSNDDLPIERALGVQWCVESDTLQFRIEFKDRPFTRRGVLATVCSVFDPLGMISPVVLNGKKILQELCRDGVDWDERIPDAVRPRWEKWRNELHMLAKVKVARCYKPKDFGSLKTAELHHFSDASQDGYGQCSYLRLTDDQDNVHCSLVMAKSRVTPLKLVTIPRLELSAALVSVKVSNLLRKELDYSQINEVFWTDSKVVLGYISNEARRFHVFVANRVQQIRDQTSPEQWHYVDTKFNPADDASRGLDAQELVNCSRWWNGPEFLWKPLETKAPTKEISSISPEDPEVKKISSFASHVEERSTLLERLNYFSDWHRAKRAVAVCLRLQARFRNRKDREETNETNVSAEKHTKCKEERSNYEPVNAKDLHRAECEIIRLAQNEAFEEEIKLLRLMNRQDEITDRTNIKKRNEAMKKTSSLYRLDPFLDKDGLLRVGGRLRLASIPYEAKHPVILPRKGNTTSMIICHFHERMEHQGRGITHNEIKSSGYWIIGGISVVTYHIAKCVKCRRLRGTTQDQKMADLPKDRLEPAPPFTYSAVDYFGPWYVKEGRRELKRYGALFTCMASRAIHIEVSNSLETDSFLNAYRRFVGRRGPVRQLRSDQGTNFIGAKNELQKALLEMNDDKIHHELLKDNCDWVVFKTNVPHASHMGGVWERQIRSVRNVLAALLDRQGTQLDDESLRTLMVEAEAIVNSRPLTVESTSSSETPMPLTPNHLLTMKSKVLLPPPGIFQRPDLYSRKRWRRVQHLANEFWIRWKKEFLQSLQQRKQWVSPRRNMQIGDIVIVKDDNLARNKWQLARVTETYTDDDGHVRKVRIAISDRLLDKQGKRTRSQTFLDRPIHKLVLLCSSDD